MQRTFFCERKPLFDKWLSFALVIRGAAPGSGFGFVHSVRGSRKPMVGCHESTRWIGGAGGAILGATEKTNSLFGLRMRVFGRRFGFWPEASRMHRLERVARRFAERTQCLLSSNDLLCLCEASAPGGDSSFVHLCAQNGKYALHKAARAMSRVGGDERSARLRMLRPTGIGVSVLSASMADLAARSAGGEGEATSANS